MIPLKEDIETAYRLLGEAQVQLDRERAANSKMTSERLDLHVKHARLLAELQQAREALDHQRKRNRELRVELRCRQEGETR